MPSQSEKADPVCECCSRRGQPIGQPPAYLCGTHLNAFKRRVGITFHTKAWDRVTVRRIFGFVFPAAEQTHGE